MNSVSKKTKLWDINNDDDDDDDDDNELFILQKNRSAKFKYKNNRYKPLCS